jgi:hypothetical protein
MMLDDSRERAEVRAYLTERRETYLKDRKARILMSAGAFLFLAYFGYRAVRKADGMPLVWAVAFGAVMVALGAVSAGLAWLIFRVPKIRRICIVLGCAFFAISLIGYAIVIGFVPGSLRFHVQNQFDLNTVFLASLAVSALSLVFFVPAGATILKEVHPPTDADIDARLASLAAQRQKAEMLAQARAANPASSARMRRRNR